MNSIGRIARLISKSEEIADRIYSEDMIHAKTMWNSIADDIIEISNYVNCFSEEKFLIYNQLVNRIASSFSMGSICADYIKYDFIPMLFTLTAHETLQEVNFSHYSLVLSDSGLYCLYDKKNNKYFNSIKDPLTEARVKAEKIFRPEYSSYYIMGTDLGYFPLALWEKSYKSMHITVFDNSLEKISMAKTYGLLGQIDEDCLEVIISEDVSELFSYFSSTEGDIDDRGYYVSESIIAEADAVTMQAMRSFKDNQLYLYDYLGRYSVNFRLNNDNKSGDFDVFLRALTEADPSLCNKTFAVVAGGPSIKDEVDYLKNGRDSLFIISVNTSVRFLLENDLVPDCIAVMDPTEGILKHLNGLEERLEKIPLVFESCAYWKYIKNYTGPKYRVVATDYESTVLKKDTSNKWNGGTTVSCLAIELAINLGAKSILLIGLDLGYPDDMLYPGIEADKKAYECYILSNSGEMIGSSHTFLSFKKEIEEIIFGNEQIRFTNLSKKGAYIEGTFIGKWWETLPNNEFKPYIERLISETMLSWKKKYYLMWQVVIKYLAEERSAGDGFWEKISDLFGVIKEGFLEESEDYTVENHGEKSAVVLMTSDFSMGGDELYEKILEDAYEIRHSAGKEILIINTSEYAGGARVALINPIVVEASTELINKDSIFYLGEKYPYFQMPINMPEIESVKVLISSLASMGVDRIISYDPFSLTAEGCKKYFKVVNR